MAAFPCPGARRCLSASRPAAIFLGWAAFRRRGSAVRRLVAIFWPPIAWVALIWIIGGLETVPSGPDVPGLDKAAHFAMYAGLGFLLGRSWALAAGGGYTWLLPLLVAFGLGAADELRQGTLPTRSSELADWLADAAGATVGFAAGVVWIRRKTTNRNR